MKLEVVVIPVSDVDRAKEFYGSLGWRLDADVAAGDDFRLIHVPRLPTASTRSGRARRTRTGPTGTPNAWCGSRPARNCRRE